MPGFLKKYEGGPAFAIEQYKFLTNQIFFLTYIPILN